MGRKQAIAAAVAIAALAIVAGYLFLRPSDAVTLRVIGEAYAPLGALDKIKAEFEKETGIRVEIVQKDHQTVVAEVDQELSSGNVTYDVVLEPHRMLGKRVGKGQVLELGPFLEDPQLTPASFAPDKDLFQNWWKEISWHDGKLYGFPFTNLTMYVAYRKDLMDAPGEQQGFKARYGYDLKPPTTWQQYMDVAEFFTRPDQNLYGTYVQGQQHIALWYEWLNFAYSFGGNILDAPTGSEYGDIVVNSPENLAATEQYMKLIKFSPPETLNYNWDDALASIQQGRVFMGLLWHDSTPFAEDPAQSKVAGKLGFSLIPSAIGRPFSQLEGWNYLIPTKAKHPREAYRFIQWAMTRPVQIEQTLGGGASAMPSVYDDERVKQLPYVPVFLESVPVGVAKPTIPESPEITELMERQLSLILSGKVAPKAGLDAMAREIKGVLGDKASLRYPPQP